MVLPAAPFALEVLACKLIQPGPTPLRQSSAGSLEVPSRSGSLTGSHAQGFWPCILALLLCKAVAYVRSSRQRSQPAAPKRNDAQALCPSGGGAGGRTQLSAFDQINAFLATARCYGFGPGASLDAWALEQALQATVR